MTNFPDTPESRREIGRQLDPDDPVLLESDRNRVVGDLSDLTRIMLRSIDAMTPAEKQSVREGKPVGVHIRRHGVLESDWYQSLGGKVDATLEYMKKNAIEINRENYLSLAYMGDIPDLDAESESMLPPEIRNEELEVDEDE